MFENVGTAYWNILSKDMKPSRLKDLDIFSCQPILYPESIKQNTSIIAILHSSETEFDIVKSFQINLNKLNF